MRQARRGLDRDPLGRRAQRGHACATCRPRSATTTATRSRRPSSSRRRASTSTLDVLMVGGEPAVKTLKEAVAMGADKGYLVEGGWDDPFDPLRTARVLAEGDRRSSTSRTSSCAGWSPRTATTASPGRPSRSCSTVPYLAPVIGVEAGDGFVQAVLDTGDVRRTVKAPTPCVLGVDSQMNVPRLPTVLQVMKVKSRPHRQGVAERRRPVRRAPELAATSSSSAASPGAVERKRIVLEGPAAGERCAARRGAPAGGGAVMAGRFIVSAASVAGPAARGRRGARAARARTAASRPSRSSGTPAGSRPPAPRPRRLAAALGGLADALVVYDGAGAWLRGDVWAARLLDALGDGADGVFVADAPAAREAAGRAGRRPRLVLRQHVRRREPRRRRTGRHALHLRRRRRRHHLAAGRPGGVPLRRRQFEGAGRGAAAPAIERRQAPAPAYRARRASPRSLSSRPSTWPGAGGRGRRPRFRQGRGPRARQPAARAPRRGARLLAAHRRGLQVAAAGAAGRSDRRLRERRPVPGPRHLRAGAAPGRHQGRQGRRVRQQRRAAPIVRNADYVVVGDLYKVVPELADRARG